MFLQNATNQTMNMNEIFQLPTLFKSKSPCSFNLSPFLKRKKILPPPTHSFLDKLPIYEAMI